MVHALRVYARVHVRVYVCARAEANWSAENVEGGRVNEGKRDGAGFYEIERQSRGYSSKRDETGLRGRETEIRRWRQRRSRSVGRNGENERERQMSRERARERERDKAYVKRR